MRTHSQTHNRNLQQQAQPAVVQPFHLEEPFVNPPLVSMADNRMMRYRLLRMLRGRQSLLTPNFSKVNYSMLERSTGIAGVTKATLGPKERIFKKKAKNKPKQARDGKGQVKPKPKSAK
ncbi:hypothetical protein Tco_1001229 [Tanacetum coccineum]